MVMDEKNVAEKNVAEEPDEAWDIADDIYKGRITRSCGASKIVAAAKAEERRAWVEALAPGNRETGLGKDVMEHGASAMAEHVTEVTKLRIRQAVAELEAKARCRHVTQCPACGCEFIFIGSEGGQRSSQQSYHELEAKIKALEAKLAATEDWESRYRAAISCMKRVLENQFAGNLRPGSPAHLYADAIVAGIARLRLELIRKQCVIDKLREGTRDL
jgi:hypothetical protein